MKKLMGINYNVMSTVNYRRDKKLTVLNYKQIRNKGFLILFNPFISRGEEASKNQIINYKIYNVFIKN